MATIDRPLFSKMLVSGADALIENNDKLTEIDSKFGDGDHGLTMTKIANVIKADCATWGDGGFKTSIKDFLEGLGDDIMGVPGGSASSLYGTLIGGLAGPLRNQTEIDAKLLKQMFTASIAEFYEITPARTGAKTMVDALAPAVEAAKAAPDDVAFTMQEAARGAHCGAEKTKALVSKFGRAKSYSDKTIGTPDAGATSVAIFIAGLAAPLSK